MSKNKSDEGGDDVLALLRESDSYIQEMSRAALPSVKDREIFADAVVERIQAGGIELSDIETDVVSLFSEGRITAVELIKVLLNNPRIRDLFAAGDPGAGAED